jgi:hypothetical protein
MSDECVYALSGGRWTEVSITTGVGYGFYSSITSTRFIGSKCMSYLRANIAPMILSCLTSPQQAGTLTPFPTQQQPSRSPDQANP